MWRPFQLNERAPVVGVNKEKMYQERFGVANTATMMARLQGVGAAVGIKFSLGGNTGNTLQSHRLVEMALEKGGSSLQNKVIESIFQSYFEEEGDVTDSSTLVACAKRAGMSGDAVASMLADRAKAPSAESVSKSVAEYRNRYRVSGVPFFVIGKNRFSGAQDADVMAEMLDAELMA